MHGIVLWFNEDKRVGVVWCEDQGPLAYIGPEVDWPEGTTTLAEGDELFFSLDVLDGQRYLRDIFWVNTAAAAGPQDMLRRAAPEAQKPRMRLI